MTEGRAANGGGGAGGAGQVPPAGSSRPPAPSGAGPIRRKVKVVNPRGLHHRVIDLFTKTAKRFESKITLWNGELKADGKDLWDLLLLVVLPETEVVLEADGPDAAAAVEPLAAILAAPGGEDYTI